MPCMKQGLQQQSDLLQELLMLHQSVVALPVMYHLELSEAVLPNEQLTVTSATGIQLTVISGKLHS